MRCLFRKVKRCVVELRKVKRWLLRKVKRCVVEEEGKKVHCLLKKVKRVRCLLRKVKRCVVVEEGKESKKEMKGKMDKKKEDRTICKDFFAMGIILA